VPSSPVQSRSGVPERCEDSGVVACQRELYHVNCGTTAAQVNDAGVAECCSALNRDGGIDALGKLVQIKILRRWQFLCRLQETSFLLYEHGRVIYTVFPSEASRAGGQSPIARTGFTWER